MVRPLAVHLTLDHPILLTRMQLTPTGHKSAGITSFYYSIHPIHENFDLISQELWVTNGSDIGLILISRFKIRGC